MITIVTRETVRLMKNVLVLAVLGFIILLIRESFYQYPRLFAIWVLYGGSNSNFGV
jgi:hypothetical protein